ncbi:metal ABC transporter substrate-binding protein [Desulforamulus aquiferis]|uniref:Metal ABC transporter substrate-binding protein n=1 Tax=Desulforamulus aquiferis TaxID=1397668 RepID=A0AAW7ZH20_9FIRM|nr:metal ABC transporter substrate-binding protein [Desulforamulus aquiferis]MDO7788619.1 metal ABC transporter substrate-binding protein [Desulforamulus aquiferis]
MKRLVLTLAALFLLAVTIAGCGTSAEDKDDRIRVMTSIYPLYDLTKNIGGDNVLISNIVPSGSEPHSWEPSPKDMADMTKADVLILSGTGMEPWADKVLANIDQSKVTVVYGGKDIALIDWSGHEDEEEHDHHNEAHDSDVPEEHSDKHKEHEHEHDQDEHQDEVTGDGHDHHHSGNDPHVWLDPLNAKIMVDNILEGLIKADEKNSSVYRANAEAYKKELDNLHEDFQKGLEGASIKEFVTSHAAFGYLAKCYGLEQIPVRGLNAESEPSPADMAAIVKLAREKNINYIFFETLVSPKVSETIAKEVRGETLVLNPLEGMSDEEMAAGKDYLSVMRENLTNLQKALNVN